MYDRISHRRPTSQPVPKQRLNTGARSVTELQSQIGNQALLRLLAPSKGRPVSVHRDSSFPDPLQAEALAQDDQVYLAPHQDGRLNHELGHIIQRRLLNIQGDSSNGGYALAAQPELEAEAETVGQRYGTYLTLSEHTDPGHLDGGQPVQACGKDKKEAESGEEKDKSGALPQEAASDGPAEEEGKAAGISGLSDRELDTKEQEKPKVPDIKTEDTEEKNSAPSPPILAYPLPVREEDNRENPENMPKLLGERAGMVRHHVFPIRLMQGFFDILEKTAPDALAGIKANLLEAYTELWKNTQEKDDEEQEKKRRDFFRMRECIIRKNQKAAGGGKGKEASAAEESEDNIRGFYRNLMAWMPGNLVLGIHRTKDPGEHFDGAAAYFRAENDTGRAGPVGGTSGPGGACSSNEAAARMNPVEVRIEKLKDIYSKLYEFVNYPTLSPDRRAAYQTELLDFFTAISKNSMIEKTDVPDDVWTALKNEHKVQDPLSPEVKIRQEEARERRLKRRAERREERERLQSTMPDAGP